MSRNWPVVAMAAVGLACTVSLMAGCQGTEVPYNQRIVVQLIETTNENPVSATVKVDGKEVFGPGDLSPGEKRPIPIHEPGSETGPKLTPGVHKVSWTLHRNGQYGKVGSVDLTIFAGTTVIKTDMSSTKYVWPYMSNSWFVNIKVKEPTTGNPALTPAKRP